MQCPSRQIRSKKNRRRPGKVNNQIMIQIPILLTVNVVVVAKWETRLCRQILYSIYCEKIYGDLKLNSTL